MHEFLTFESLQIIIAGFLVGAVVGVTGMGGGALMTPALIFLGVGGGAASTIVTADLTAAAVYKTGGAAVHWRSGAPHLKLAFWLMAGSVPFALAGPFLLRLVAPATSGSDFENLLKECIGFALLLAAATYAIRLWINLARVRKGHPDANPEPKIRPIPTLLIGALGGLLVGITSVGAGSVIMVFLLMLYPGLAAVRMVGTDLVQAVPLVLAAAVSNILASSDGLDLTIAIPLIIGSVPGTILGSRLAPRIPTSFVRRAIVVVLVMSGVALLDKAGWAPLGAGEDDEHPVLIGVLGLALVFVVPIVWGFIRKSYGLPMFGGPTVAELEGYAGPTDDGQTAPRQAGPAEDSVGGSTEAGGASPTTGARHTTTQ